jgi:hypothetical protein
MCLSTAYQLASIGTFLATLGLVAVAWWQIALLRKQSRTAFEDSLTEQYRGIMDSIPIDVWLGSELTTLDEERRDRCRNAIYRYIDLSNDQAQLHDKGKVTDDAWAEWSAGITSNMRLPAFKEVWTEVASKRPESFRELRLLIDLSPVAPNRI